MHQFAHIDLEAAIAISDVPMHMLERTGQGDNLEIRLYPLNQAAIEGYGDFRRAQGLTIEKYFQPLPKLLPIFRRFWKPVLEDGEPVSHYRTTLPLGSGELRDFITSVYRVEWSADHALAFTVSQDVTEQNVAMAALRDANTSLAAQASLIEELSVPVVTLWDGVLSAPIVGAIDSHRSSRLTEALLNAITHQQAAFAIIDITGVPIVDTQVANYLIQMMQAATLLGCQSILVGISPEIAQTVVQLGVNLSAIRTAPTMQRGLEIALLSLGYRVQRPGKGG